MRPDNHAVPQKEKKGGWELQMLRMKLVQHEQVPYFDNKLVSLEGLDVLEIDEVTVI